MRAHLASLDLDFSPRPPGLNAGAMPHPLHSLSLFFFVFPPPSFPTTPAAAAPCAAPELQRLPHVVEHREHFVFAAGPNQVGLGEHPDGANALGVRHRGAL